jgi:hypothetical protein
VILLQYCARRQGDDMSSIRCPRCLRVWLLEEFFIGSWGMLSSSDSKSNVSLITAPLRERQDTVERRDGNEKQKRCISYLPTYFGVQSLVLFPIQPVSMSQKSAAMAAPAVNYFLLCLYRPTFISYLDLFSPGLCPANVCTSR